MRNSIVIVLALAGLAAPCAADGRLFLTRVSDGYGLTRPQNALIPTLSTVDNDNNNYNAYDYYNGDYVVGAYPPPSTPSNLGVSAGNETVYIWGQFDGAAPRNLRVNGLWIGVRRNATHPALNFVAYACNDMQGNSAQKRWDGTYLPGVYSQFSGFNPLLSIAIPAKGIVNENGADPPNLYSGAAAGRLFLYGALQIPAVDGNYDVTVEDGSYWNGQFSASAWTSATFTVVVPEPGGLLLLAFGWLLTRRR